MNLVIQLKIGKKQLRNFRKSQSRGALMLSIDIRHPDVEKFINIKKDLSKVTGANISVMVRDDFMEAVKADKDYILRWPYDTAAYEQEFIDDAKKQLKDKEYNMLYSFIRLDGKKYHIKKVKAKEVWNQIIEAAHSSAEPGILFVDKHWDNSPDTVYPTYKGITTNP